MDIAMLIVLVVLAVANAWMTGYNYGCHRSSLKAEPVKQEAPEMTEDEQALREEERRQIMEDNRAFQAMLDYNASMAYGMAREDKR